MYQLVLCRHSDSEVQVSKSIHPYCGWSQEWAYTPQGHASLPRLWADESSQRKLKLRDTGWKYY